MNIDKDKAVEVLKGLTPFSKDAKSEYVPEVFKLLEESLRPVFIIRSMTLSERAEIERLSFAMARNEDYNELAIKKAVESGGGEFNMIESDTELQRMFEITNNCIIDVKNLIDSGSVEVIKWSSDMFFYLPEFLKKDLVREVRIVSGIWPNAKKY